MRMSEVGTPGGRATFSASIGESASRAVLPVVKVAGAAVPRALVVCVDSRLRDQLGRAASEIGCAFACAESAEGALKLLAQQPHDLALIDLDLRSGGGTDLLGTVRQRWTWVQMILLGAVSEDDSTRHAIRFGVSEFLTKPCSQREIVAAMTRAYRRRVQDAAGTIAIPISAAHATGQPTGQTTAQPTGSAATSDSDSAIAAIGNSRPSSLGEIERVHILAALQRNKGNRETAASELGISVRKLYYRLQQYHRDGLIS